MKFVRRIVEMMIDNFINASFSRTTPYQVVRVLSHFHVMAGRDAILCQLTFYQFQRFFLPMLFFL